MIAQWAQSIYVIWKLNNTNHQENPDMINYQYVKKITELLAINICY